MFKNKKMNAQDDIHNKMWKTPKSTTKPLGHLAVYIYYIYISESTHKQDCCFLVFCSVQFKVWHILPIQKRVENHNCKLSFWSFGKMSPPIPRSISISLQLVGAKFPCHRMQPTMIRILGPERNPSMGRSCHMIYIYIYYSVNNVLSCLWCTCTFKKNII